MRQAALIVAIDTAQQSASHERAVQLADRLNAPLVAWPIEAADTMNVAADDIASDADAPLYLLVTDHRLELRPAWALHEPGLVLELEQIAHWPAGRQPTRKQPLGRAIGRSTRTVIDATAGLGRDAMLLAAMGCTVTCIERSAVLHAMLADALQHCRERGDARSADLASRITLVHADARTVLATLPPADVIYIDPMFPPPRRATALAKKQIRIVRSLVGSDDDALQLLQLARHSATRRVVLKRPDHAQPLMDDVTAMFPGKLVRYDVYVRP